MNCQDTERLLELRAAELLSTEEAGALAAHLAVCAACEGQAQALEGLFDAARLPALTAQEEKRVADLRHFLPPPRRTAPVLRWAGMSAAVAASALLGLHFGGAAPSPRVAPPATHAQVSARAAARTGSGFEDAADVLPSFDADGDSALYDAVVFQGGAMPFDLDNG